MNKIISNSIWLMVEKVLFLLGGFFISVYVGRYLGPQKLGIITFATSISAILIAITELGANHTIYNRVVKNKNSAIRLIEATFNVRVSIYLICSVIAIYYLSETIINKEDLIVSVIIILSSIFTGIDTYQYYYNGTLNSKINALSSQISFMVILLLRFLFTKYQLGFVWFAIPLFIQPFLVFIFRYYYFKLKTNIYKIKNRRNVSIYSLYCVSTGIPLVVSSLSIVLYTKINNFIISDLLGDKYLGLFSIAQQLGLLWVFIPNAITMSLLTKIISEKNESLEYGISFIIIVVLSVSLPFVFLFYFFSDYVIFYTYGHEFKSASNIIYLIAISGVFSCIGFINNRVLSSMGLYRFLLVKTIFVGLISVPLSYFLIINFELYGAALSMLIIELLASTIINYFNCKVIRNSQLRFWRGRNYIGVMLSKSTL